MGLDPDADEGIEITNGEFSAGAGWDIRTWWSIAGGKALVNRLTAVENGLRQYNFPVVKGNEYTIAMLIDSLNFVDPVNKGVYMSCFGHNSPVYLNAGLKTFTFILETDSTTFALLTNSTDVGDQAQIDYVTLSSQGDYIGDVLGINWARARKKEYGIYAGNRRNQICASRFDKSNCLIGFDV